LGNAAVVILAKARIQDGRVSQSSSRSAPWIPAFAGMTGGWPLLINRPLVRSFWACRRTCISQVSGGTSLFDKRWFDRLTMSGLGLITWLTPPFVLISVEGSARVMLLRDVW